MASGRGLPDEPCAVQHSILLLHALLGGLQQANHILQLLVVHLTPRSTLLEREGERERREGGREGREGEKGGVHVKCTCTCKSCTCIKNQYAHNIQCTSTLTVCIILYLYCIPMPTYIQDRLSFYLVPTDPAGSLVGFGLSLDSAEK